MSAAQAGGQTDSRFTGRATGDLLSERLVDTLIAAIEVARNASKADP